MFIAWCDCAYFTALPNGEYRCLDLLQLDKAITGSVETWFLMFESLQRLQVKWPVDDTENLFSMEPDVYAYADENGVPLSEPKLYHRGEKLRVAEDGSITEMRYDENLKLVVPWGTIRT